MQDVLSWKFYLYALQETIVTKFTLCAFIYYATVSISSRIQNANIHEQTGAFYKAYYVWPQDVLSENVKILF